MVSIFKNQILKQLSKFAKNLSSDQVQLSTLRGHCELQNLELNELVLTDVLELPSWLRITKAVCNSVTIKIHWTKLKSVPIHLSLDEVLVDTETCEDLRTLSSQSLRQSYSIGGKYGFSDRVIDGMTVVVNSVIINFKSPFFQSSIQISRVLLESRTPNWKKADLRLSRIKNVEHGELLIFKQLDWQVLRIEAKARATEGVSEMNITPLRLITNQASCKITIKKKLSDCSVMGCRIILVLDDLLWVLTDAQLVAALHFVNSLSNLVQQANELSKKSKAKRKLEQQPEKHSGHTSHSPKTSSTSQRVSSIIRYFNQYDIIETSYHVYCGRIDLHLCDDLDTQNRGFRKSNFRDGGALQVSLHKLSADYYPYHRAFGSRDHWLRYNEPSSGRSGWVQQLMSLFHENMQSSFQSELYTATETSGSKSRSSSRHASVQRAPPHTFLNNNSMDTNKDGGRRSSIGQYKKAASQWSLKYLMSSCFVVCLEDYAIYKVSVAPSSKKYTPEKFVASDKTSLILPSDMKSVHLEMTYYYFPGDVTLPVPTPNIFIHLGPVQLTYDETTVLWLNTFLLNVVKCIELASNSHSSSLQSFLLSLNIRAELLMPQIIIPAEKSYPTQSLRPKALHLQASRIVATNCRIGDHASSAQLNQCLESLNHGSMFFDRTKFPWKEGDINPIAEKFLQNIMGLDTVKDTKNKFQSFNGMNSRIDTIIEGHDIWSVHLDPCWADFTYSEQGQSRVTFVDPFPITLWIYVKMLGNALKQELNSHIDVNQNGIEVGNMGNDDVSTPLFTAHSATDDKDSGKPADKLLKSDEEGDIYVLIHIQSLLNMQINHFQYLFLLRLLDSVVAVSAQLAEDTSAIITTSRVPKICITSWLPQIELSFVLHNLNQISAISGSGDIPSFRDDASLEDELITKKRTLSSTHSSFSLGDCDTHTKGFDSRKTDSLTIESSENRPLPKSNSDLLLNSHSNSSSSLVTQSQTIEKSADQIHKSIHSGTSAMRRGFCNLMASIDSVLTKNDGSLPSDSDLSHCDDDTLSMKSDFSSDSDQYVLVGLDSCLADDDIFNIRQSTEAEVEEAIEIKEDSISIRTSTNSLKKKEMVSVLTLKLLGIEVAIQNTESANCICVRCHRIETNEQPAISIENFNNIFSTKSRGWQADKISEGPPSETQVSLRMSKTIVSQENKLSIRENDFLSLFIKDINLSMLMSSLSGIIDLLDDEIIPQPIPTRIIVNNLKLHLQEDRPSSNLTSSGTIPLHFHLPGCLLERSADGYVHLLPLPSDFIDRSLPLLINEKSLPILITNDKCDWQSVFLEKDNLNASLEKLSASTIKSTLDCKCMKIENLTGVSEKDLIPNSYSDYDKLKRKLNSLQNLERENKLLKEELSLLQNVHNDSILHKQLVEARDEVRRLEEEKKSLLDTLQVLQEELSKFESRKK